MRPNQQGFAYLWALMMVLVMAIYLSEVGDVWKTKIQRAHEEELLRVGDQIRLAIKAYAEQAGNQYPKTLNDLVQDPRSSTPKHYLRHAYKDPMTGDDWVLMSGPNGGFLGVYSKSTLKPIKTSNFPTQYSGFNDKTTFQDWRFAYYPTGGGGRR
ncbi:type II secretion system protein [Andreprevotia chitinilytica]|uniref:type II secretion system protein n=1 Tax=Andreprevotia chitinilytica TaxID=396808 RepID=UPI000553DDFA|nr:type II secretion system protein [Andreprevotia chitinilytica]